MKVLDGRQASFLRALVARRNRLTIERLERLNTRSARAALAVIRRALAGLPVSGRQVRGLCARALAATTALLVAFVVRVAQVALSVTGALAAAPTTAPPPPLAIRKASNAPNFLS